jgi:hypothetical protein
MSAGSAARARVGCATVTTLITLFGIAAFMASGMLGMPVSRELMLKLGTLVDWTRRTNPELFREKIEPISPFVGKSFKHNRISKMLKVDLSQFGETCQKLQRDAKALDKRAHVAMIPALVYVLGLGVWFAVT